MNRCILPAAILLLSIATASSAAENLCGWVQNPTPGNWWLTDKDGDWIMTAQGQDFEPEGMDLIGDISEHDYVASNGNYGYACGCIKADVDLKSSRITTIHAFRQLPLSKCENDSNLPKPD